MDTKTKTQEGRNVKSTINWFEIPVLDIDRAMTFYNRIFGFEMEMTQTQQYAMAFFPGNNTVGGALVKGPGCIPSQTGSLIYLDAGGDLQPILDRIKESGGRVILEKTKIDDGNGCFGLFIDSEGNKLALHAKKEATPETEPVDTLEAEEAVGATEEEEEETVGSMEDQGPADTTEKQDPLKTAEKMGDKTELLKDSPNAPEEKEDKPQMEDSVSHNGNKKP